MKKSRVLLLSLLVATAMSTFFTACVKKEYDEPEINNVDPNLVVNRTILDMRDSATSAPKLITQDIIIQGIITADDESGAFYKEMVIQDNSGGLSILLDVSNFNSSYPIGRRVFVKCKGLYISKDADGIVEIGTISNGAVARIPSTLVQKYIVPGKWGLELPYQYQNLDYLNTHLDQYCQMLVKMPSLEFKSSDMNVAWGGDPNSSSDNNRTLQDCSGNNLIVYTSAYASFANNRTPVRNGSIAGILKVYRGAGELVIRGLGDVNMDSTRCDGSSGIPQYIPLDSIRMLNPPGTNVVTLPGDIYIRAIVTSDNSTSMINGQNLYCQDQTAGIQVRFTGAHAFPIGTELQITVGGMELSYYRGVLQINNVPLTAATVINPPMFTIGPRVTTISDINTNYTAWQGQVVKLNNVTISSPSSPPSTTYSGNLTMDDGSGATITLYTASGASFSGATFPTTPVSVTGILVEYNGTKEIIIRNLSDVQ